MKLDTFANNMTVVAAEIMEEDGEEESLNCGCAVTLVVGNTAYPSCPVVMVEDQRLVIVGAVKDKVPNIAA